MLDETALVLQRSLLAIVLPLWLAAGFADWACHRSQRIECNAGWRESALHVLMLVELGLAIGAALLLAPSAAVLVLCLTMCVTHDLTLFADLHWAIPRRPIPAIEQWVHGFQVVLPWVALGALSLLYRAQWRALLGGEGDWSLRWRDPPVPVPLLTALGVAALLLVVLPFAEELWRCVRASATTSGRDHAA